MLDISAEKAQEAVGDLEERNTPEFEGLAEAAEQKEVASDQADLDAKSFERELQRAQALRRSSAGGAGELDSASLKDLDEKQKAARKSVGDAEFAARALSSDEAAMKETQEKIKELDEEHAQLVKDTTGWTKFLTLKPQFVLEKTKRQNEEEEEAQERMLRQQEKKVAQDKERKFKSADAANVANEDLVEARKSTLRSLQLPDEGTGQDSALQQVAGAVNKASEANKDMLEALMTFQATAEAIKTYSTASKQKFDDVIRTLEAHTRAISEINSRLRSGTGGVQQ